jgi:hypothetical protein
MSDKHVEIATADQPDPSNVWEVCMITSDRVHVEADSLDANDELVILSLNREVVFVAPTTQVQHVVRVERVVTISDVPA